MNKFNLPTWLTLSRFGAAITIPLIYLVFDQPIADYCAFAVFALAAITDFADGQLARLMSLESRLGAALDTVADKALVLVSLSILLAYIDSRQWLLIPVSVIFVRELLIAGLREYLGPSSSLKVTWTAKCKTASQMISISFLFLSNAIDQFGNLIGLLGIIILWISSVLTIVSGIDYIQKAIKDMESRNEPN